MTTWATLSVAAGCSLLLVNCTTQAPRSGLVVSNVTVVSPERDASLEHAYVRIIDGRIAELAERPLRGETEIDGTGRYLIPGLIDSHVHLAVPPGFPSPLTTEQAAAHPDIVTAALSQDPLSYLFYGFTTVVDLVGSAERTAQWNAREVRPDAYFCGAAVVINSQIRYALFPYFSYGLTFEERIPSVVDPALHTPEAVVARMAGDGAICVKTVHDAYAGVTPTMAEVQALVAAAHARDMPVFIHANRKSSQAAAVAAGVDVIAHGMWRDGDEEPALDDEARQILMAVARNGIGYQPTTQVIVGELDMLDDDYLAQPELADAYPSVVIDWYARMRGQLAHWTTNAGPGAGAGSRRTVERGTEVTRFLAETDANLLFGSDTPSDWIYTNPPGLNGRHEMDNWIAAGVAEEKLFRALTIDNARMLRLDHEIGTVEPGKTANLLLLSADPRRSVDAYDTIETVFLHGRPMSRGELSARNTSRGAVGPAGGSSSR